MYKRQVDTVCDAVKKMYTDPNHLRVSDPGTVEGNAVFCYLDVFDPDKQALDVMKEHYRRGGLGDTIVKNRLLEVLLALLDPIRARRHEFAKDPGEVMRILKDGTAAAQEVAAKTIQEVRASMGIDYFQN